MESWLEDVNDFAEQKFYDSIMGKKPIKRKIKYFKNKRKHTNEKR